MNQESQISLVNELDADWRAFLNDEFEKPYFQELTRFVNHAYDTELVYPARRNIFKAFSLCKPKDVKVVILGQDPYHGPGQAHGLSFSVPSEVDFPPSLRNIFKEITSDCSVSVYNDGNLGRWARQGVFLINSVLTVKAGCAASHQHHGWEQFTDQIIRKLSDNGENIVFILWGNSAIAKRTLINADRHLVLTGVHPSPLSAYRGFFGCKHFSSANSYLQQHDIPPIDWR